VFPTHFGPYELLRPLGAGGMAETFVAVRRGPAGFEQRVCLKRILPGYSGDPSFVDLFLDEARLLAQLRNGNIVQVYDFGEAEGTYYMALELVDGADLENLLSDLQRRGERLSQDMVLYIAAQLLEALEYAHAASADGQPLGIVHRDVSPSNILVSSHGEVKLTDFGIAKARGRKHQTQTGHTKGKLSYMSPEQVRGEALDGRSDLFAVGIVLYELLAGVHPFEAETDLTLLNNILASKRRPLVELVPGIASELLSVIESMLAADAAARPASAGTALAALPHPSRGFGAQRALAAHVVRYQAERPAREPRAATPGRGPGSGGLESRDGSTQVLPPGKTPSDRLAFKSHKTTQHLVAPEPSRRGLWLTLAALGLLAAVGTFFLLTPNSEKAAVGGAAGQPAGQEPMLAPVAPGPELEQVPTGTPGSESPRTADRAPEQAPAADGPEPQADGVAASESSDDGAAEQAASGKPRVLHTAEEAEDSPRTHARKRRESSSTPKPSAKTPHTASETEERARTRSGLGVSTDEF
jgi:serine/threonine protein kinase